MKIFSLIFGVFVSLALTACGPSAKTQALQNDLSMAEAQYEACLDNAVMQGQQQQQMSMAVQFPRTQTKKRGRKVSNAEQYVQQWQQPQAIYPVQAEMMCRRHKNKVAQIQRALQQSMQEDQSRQTAFVGLGAAAAAAVPIVVSIIKD